MKKRPIRYGISFSLCIFFFRGCLLIVGGLVVGLGGRSRYPVEEVVQDYKKEFSFTELRAHVVFPTS